MGASRPLQISMLATIAILLGAGVAEGHVLSSAHLRAKQPLFEVAANRPREDVEPDGDKSKAVASQAGPKVQEVKRSMDYAKQQAKVDNKSGPKYPIIALFDGYLSKLFGKYTDSWYLDWKFWVGIIFWAAVWAKWLYYGYDEIYWQRAMFAFGINIWILHELQYASTIKIGMIVVCIVLSIQTLFQTWVWYHADAPEDELSDFDCDTLYLDLKLPAEQIAVLFIAQFGVWWFYMTSILGNFDFSEVNYLFWVWAYLVMQMTMIFNRGADSVLGNPFPVHDVDRITRNANKVSFGLLNEEGELEGERFRMSRTDILVRGVLGFFCNSILREIMAYTIPLMLMGFSEPMDFVVYCVGVNFICTLDDMTELKYSLTPIKEQGEDLEATEATAEKTT